ncbi:MAG TPA: calcium-binding protein [Gordonia sp. (in: high G+C Gram-positive bacteria)]|nr:calcium-binding protein [Gordonia sp. (in: high G+C Gram-positive bacteria)]
MTSSKMAERGAVLRVSGLAATVAIVGLAVGACGDDSDSSDSTAAAGSTAVTTATDSTTADSGSGGSYKDGTYSATGKYVTPGGEQSIGVTVTLASNKVTALELDRSQTHGTSATFQEKFAGGIDELVIGKNLNDLDDIKKVSGSSLTSGGFKKAIAQIKEEAAE